MSSNEEEHETGIQNPGYQMELEERKVNDHNKHLTPYPTYHVPDDKIQSYFDTTLDMTLDTTLDTSFDTTCDKINETSEERVDENSQEKVKYNSFNSMYFERLTKSRRRRFSIRYDHVVWFVFIFLTFLALLDRFVGTGDYLFNRSSRKPCCKEWGKNLGEIITNALWYITARLMITGQNLMFWVVLWCIPNMLYENTPRWLKIYGIRDVHIQIHRICGIFLMGIPAIVHVAIIFLPPLMDGTMFEFVPPSARNYSSHSDGLNWTLWWDPAAIFPGFSFNDELGIHFTADEIFRLVLMLVVFGILFPLSLSNFLNKRSYSLAISLHFFAALLFAVDNIRKISHKLSHLFNLPFFIIWCIDRLISIMYYRKHKARIVRHQVLGETEYVVTHVKLDQPDEPGVGDIYYLTQQLMSKWGMPQRAHPFTSFSNHKKKDTTWDVGFVTSVIPDDQQWFQSWTRRLAEAEMHSDLEEVTLHAWGPYRSSIYHLYQQLVLKEPEENRFVLLAGGSGFGYLMDAVGILAYQHTPKNNTEIPHVDIHFSIRCRAFIEYMRADIEHLLQVIRDKNSGIVTFTVYVTDNDKGFNAHQSNDSRDEILIKKGRFSADKILKGQDKSSIVYFVGSGTLAKQIGAVCDRLGLRFVKDYTNSTSGSDKKTLVKYSKYTVYATIITVISCLVLNIYVRVKKLTDNMNSPAAIF